MAPSIPTRRPRFLNAQRLTLAIAAVALIGGGYLAWQSPAQATAVADSTPPAVPVTVAAAVERQVVMWDEFSGRLEAVGSVEVRSRVAGTIESIHFAAGSLVNRGDTLMVIDPKPFAAAADRAEAAVAAAKARVVLTGSELSRAKRLHDEDAIAQRELDTASNANLEAQAALQSAQSALRMAKLDLGYTRVVAPITGRVGRAEVTVGNLVAGGAAGPMLTSIVSVSPMYASFEADERTYLKYASLGTRNKRIPVQMGLANESGHPRQGTIEWVDNQLDTKSGTIRVRALFDNKDGLLTPGLYARLKVGGSGASNAVLIDDRAVATDQHKKYVFVVGNDSKVAYREITLGGHVDGLRVVQDGLSAGEHIVVNGLQRVRPGTAVAPQMVAMDAGVEQRSAKAAQATPIGS